MNITYNANTTDEGSGQSQQLEFQEESCGLEWFNSNDYPLQPDKDEWKNNCKARKNIEVVPDHYIRCFCGAPDAENTVFVLFYKTVIFKLRKKVLHLLICLHIRPTAWYYTLFLWQYWFG